MSKALKNSNLTSRPVARTLAAVSLSLSLAAFGCTTDRTLGNGDPVTTPGLRTSPTGGTSSGSESAPTVPPSMTSSSGYVGAQMVSTNPMRRLSAAEAAAVMSQQQPRVKYLGVAYPGNGGGYASDVVVPGQYQNPAMRTNPQRTVNSSLTSGPTSVVASGQGEAVGSTGSGITGAAVIAGTGSVGTGLTSAGITGTSANAGLTSGTTAAGITGTSTNAGLTSGTTAAGITGASTSAGLTTGSTAIFAPTTAAASSGTLLPGTTASVTRTADARSTLGVTNTTTNTATSNANTTASSTAASTASAQTSGASGPVRIMRDANGRAVITNANGTRSNR